MFLITDQFTKGSQQRIVVVGQSLEGVQAIVYYLQILQKEKEKKIIVFQIKSVRKHKDREKA